MKRSKPKKNILRGEIIRMHDHGIDTRIEELSPDELHQHIQRLDAQLREKQYQLAKLQVTEVQEHLASRHRELQIEKYIHEIAALDRITPGGLKSVQPSEGDDPDLVYEAWCLYVYRQRGGGSRW